MWYIILFICFLLINLSLSLPIITDNISNISSPSIDYESPINNSNVCSIQAIDIDKPVNETIRQHSTSTTIYTIDILLFKSSWEQTIVTNTDEINNNNDGDDHATSLNIIQIKFTIPYQISNESILNKTIFIIDITHTQLLSSITDICLIDSSFFLNYSTIQPLPHNICLYLLLNLTSSSSINLKEIIFCRTIEDSNTNTSSSHDTETTETHAVGPSGFFILSQCIIILLMMFIIYGVQTAREKSLVDRVSQRLVHSQAYKIIFGNKTNQHRDSHTRNSTINPATTLQAGLNHMNFHRQLASLAIHQRNPPIEEQVLAANDLTSTINDRRATRVYINRDLIDVKEFTKRMSLPNDTSTDTELNPV